MSSSQSILGRLLDLLLKSFSTRTPRTPQSEPGRPGASGPRARLRDEESGAGAQRGSETVRIDPGGIRDLRVEYAPSRDGAPDAGEVIWTWVPYEENDGRGKDRPVLVIGRQSAQRVYAVRMTSKPHERDRDYLGVGAGDWDSQGRESWVDIEQLYSVHESGMRREAAILDRSRYERVAEALVHRYGWAHR
ncbi:type II toxin-antitoxin system PemK/MazF family toxin [Microbacterium sp. YMB-B2]|uniref:Type II toxin-antitoxin system PemK/MazF family toxin n=1 Tax=Microbacterium tenebrionis TaxID=2830665 RepID=A0A9X1LNN4_9MICO|nr:type II toxin-antitoxin system PemK/MazF family toxin [Microbacterium tenebrionis]MCC2028937.1 type II toxin-antitoxin system PemK/MazF family toxin [Microbacterium tenebrionis]